MSGLNTVVITNCPELSLVRQFAFRALKNLKTLIISNNPKLIQIDAYAFGSLRNLNYLSLSKNRLAEISGYIFSSSSSIHTIDFIGNPISVSYFYLNKFNYRFSILMFA